MTPRLPALVPAVAVAAVLASFAGSAEAAPPWVERHLTLPSGTWAFDLGLGIGHTPPAPEDTAVGINMEMAVAIDRVELGVRTGIRPGDLGERAIEADSYGRLFDRQYFNGGVDALANPEFRVRVAILRGPVADLAVEGRIIIPVGDPGNVGLEPGLPLAFHLGDRVRLDTGVFLPIVTGQNSYVGISLPLDLWIQITDRLWLGPMTGIQDARLGGPPYNPLYYRSNAYVSLGFGLGYQITRFLDFKTMILMPDISDDTRFFGVGAGVQIRIE
jgi:hypothetical protein